MTSLELTLLYLLAAVLGVVACRSLKLPPMLGYLVRLTERMNKRRFPPDDTVLQAASLAAQINLAAE